MCDVSGSRVSSWMGREEANELPTLKARLAMECFIVNDYDADGLTL